MQTNRRNFIRQSILTTAGISAGYSSLGNHLEKPLNTIPIPDDDAFKISVFSKNLQWLGYAEMAQIAAGMGFDGIDLTVRPGGHVLPEKVADDLPKAVETIRKTGLNVFMITTAILDADDPLTDTILKTASSLGIRHYRMGWYHYDEKKNIEENLKDFEAKFRKLALLNKKYSINGEYQNHSGSYFGAPIWDLYTVLNRVKLPWLGSQYDILHASVEGANTWPIGLKLLKPYIRSIDIKDFQWAKKEGKWVADVVPLGEGLVDFKTYFANLKKLEINVPVSMHFEYELGGAENGASTLTVKREEVIASMTKDLATLRSLLQAAGI